MSTNSHVLRLLYDLAARLLTLRLYRHITEDLYLASEAHIRILFEIAPQPELLHERQTIRIDRWRDSYTVGATQTVPMTIAKFPHTAIDGHIFLQRGIAHAITLWYVNAYIFTHIRYAWHDSILQIKVSLFYPARV
jgi:hypothetical protein